MTTKVKTCFRQQLCYEDCPKLADWLGMKPAEIKKFDVYVTPMMDGNIDDLQPKLGLNQIKEVIDQLIDGLEQLKVAEKTHNDIKPTNLLYLKTATGYDIKLSDFGQAGKMGGTPGWTAPVFFKERQPGREDLFSAGWVILRLLCHSQSSIPEQNKELFKCLRDNFIENRNQTWLVNFRKMIEIDFVSKLVNLDKPLTLTEVKNEWNKIRPSIAFINKQRLLNLGVPAAQLKIQYNFDRLVQTNFVIIQFI